MSERHPATLADTELREQCTVTTRKASGPGGQRRNKVETGVVIVHEPSGTRAEASERRRRADNERVAWMRLRVNLALGVRATAGPVTELWRRRAREGLRVAVDHHDFPALLAEALDALAVHGHEPREAAAALGCSASRLVRLLKLEPRALGWLNDRRREAGLHRLH